MKKNVGSIDRMIRIAIAVAVAVVLFTNTVAIGSTLGIILAVVGVIMAFTSTASWCAIYAAVGASTCKVKA